MLDSAVLFLLEEIGVYRPVVGFIEDCQTKTPQLHFPKPR
jgi:hypothetical protein